MFVSSQKCLQLLFLEECLASVRQWGVFSQSQPKYLNEVLTCSSSPRDKGTAKTKISSSSLCCHISASIQLREFQSASTRVVQSVYILWVKLLISCFMLWTILNYLTFTYLKTFLCEYYGVSVSLPRRDYTNNGDVSVWFTLFLMGIYFPKIQSSCTAARHLENIYIWLEYIPGDHFLKKKWHTVQQHPHLCSQRGTVWS